MPSLATAGLRVVPALALLTLGPGWAQAQTPDPSPAPSELGQDALDLRGRTGLVVGSGARAYGMGGAFLARADDATAASWNPAGLSYLRRPEMTAVGVRNSFATRENASSTDSKGITTLVEETDNSIGYAPDFLAATHPVTLGSTSGAVQVSFQRVFAFGGRRRTKREGILREIDVTGGFDVVAAGTGLRVAQQLRLGITINRWLNGYDQRLQREGGRRSDQFAQHSLAGWNVNLGAIWSPWESLNLGVVGKSPFHGSVTLRRRRTDFHDLSSGTVLTSNAHSSDDVRLDFPGALGVGASWRPRSPITVSADYTRTFWSDSHIRNYFTLARTPVGEEDSPPPPQFYDRIPYPTLDDPGQQDTEQVRVGLEYVFVGRRLRLPMRVGYFIDQQNFRARDGRAPRFNGFTLGAGVGLGTILVDAAFLYEAGDYVNAPNRDSSVKARKMLVSIIYRQSGR